MSFPKYITVENYEKSKELINEAIIARNRGLIILAGAEIEGYEDIHGFIEAFQHCLELYLKALWNLVGLKYPHNHDPAKNIEKVNARLIEVMPYLKNQPLFETWEKWIREKSRYYAGLHHKTIYGDESTGTVASKLFMEEDVRTISHDVHFVLSFLSGMYIRIGSLLGVLTDVERKRLQDDTKIGLCLKKSGLYEKLYEAIQNILDETINERRS